MKRNTRFGAVYIVWFTFQRRALSMQRNLHFELFHLPYAARARLLKVPLYIIQAFWTAVIILRKNPRVVWFQSPPSFIAHILVGLRMLPGLDYKIVADCHNSALRSPWSRIPLITSALNRCDLVLVHNVEATVEARTLGVKQNRLAVLEDPPAFLDDRLSVPSISEEVQPTRPYALVPCSFSSDEPVNDLLMAAALTDEVDFVITGPLRKAEDLGYAGSTPANVKFPGFVPISEYDRLLAQANVVVGLTKMEGIQLSVASEAIGAGRPLVLSDTRILRNLFGSAALFTDNSPESVSAAVRSALRDAAKLAKYSRDLAEERMIRWRGTADDVLSRLSSS
jgi:glycosyltransferase involved in cell wall biosynthesis